MPAPIVTLKPQDSLDVIWTDVVFTSARLSARKETHQLAPPYQRLIERLDQRVRVERYEHWLEETIADAVIDAADEDLDECVVDIDATLQHVLGRDTSSPRYTRYFREAPSRITRMALAAELARVDGWVKSLASEPEAELKARSKRLAAVAKLGYDALDRRTAAAAARADHFTRDLTVFVQDVNDQRIATYGQLIDLGQKLGKRPASIWASRFFRKGSRASTPPAAETPPAPAAVPASTPVAGS